MTDDTIHTCSYECERPECIRAQRDELVARLTAAQQQGGGECSHEAWEENGGWCKCVDCGHGWSARTAPPSAPVGVKTLSEFMAEQEALHPGIHDKVQAAADELRASLAQQPAATRVRCGDERYELDAYLWRRESTQEWVLELSGAINDTSFTNRFPVPLSYAPEDAVSLPNYVEQPAAVDGADAQAAEIEALRAEVDEWKDVAKCASEQQDSLFNEARALNELADNLRAEVYFRDSVIATHAADTREYQKRISQAEARAERLAEALQEARDAIEDWAGYASDYFREKHDLAGDLAKVDALLRDQEEGHEQ